MNKQDNPVLEFRPGVLASKKQIKVFGIDDHPIILEGLQAVVSETEGLEWVGSASTSDDALKKINELNPDLVTLDLSLRDSNGFELLSDIFIIKPNLPTLILSMHDEKVYAEKSLRAGARGYIMKDSSYHEIIVAIKTIIKGHLALGDEVKSTLLENFVDPESVTIPTTKLTKRETEVYVLLGNGLNLREIAEEMELSVKTIETYIDRIKEKLSQKTLRALSKSAIRWVNLTNINQLS